MILCENCLKNDWELAYIRRFPMIICKFCGFRKKFPIKNKKTILQKSLFKTKVFDKNDLFVDGYCIGINPSSIGGGYTVFLGDKFIKTEQILKEYFTNNEAELIAILEGCRFAEKNQNIITDSDNALKWIRRGRSRARPDLNFVISEINNLKREKNLKIIWQSRETNFAGFFNEIKYES